MAGVPRTSLGLAWTLGAVLGGCQLLTGATERNLTTDQSCRLTTDCPARNICLFGFCSPECRADRDCARGSRCLQTAQEAACVRPERADCGAQPCPEGTECVDNQCRTSCSLTGLPCLEGQACVGSVCIENATALDAGTFCTGAACDAGVRCEPVQTDGDCQKQVCIGNTVLTTEPDPVDLPIDGNECTKDICTGGVASNPDEDEGKPCLGGTCLDGTCTGPCSNRRRDGKETDVDCGGGECPKCDEGLACRLSSDCAGEICTSCSSQFVCDACRSECTPAKCGEPPITIYGSCFAVVLLRDGSVVEAQSSPELCETTEREVWKRGRDVTYVYSEHLPDHEVQALGSNSGYFPIEWFSRCVRKLGSRAELVAELNASSDWIRHGEPIGPLIEPRMNCPQAALYKW